jgi:hypothetical protein
MHLHSETSTAFSKIDIFLGCGEELSWNNFRDCSFRAAWHGVCCLLTVHPDGLNTVLRRACRVGRYAQCQEVRHNVRTLGTMSKHYSLCCSSKASVPKEQDAWSMTANSKKRTSTSDKVCNSTSSSVRFLCQELLDERTNDRNLLLKVITDDKTRVYVHDQDKKKQYS